MICMLLEIAGIIDVFSIINGNYVMTQCPKDALPRLYLRSGETLLYLQPTSNRK